MQIAGARSQQGSQHTPYMNWTKRQHSYSSAHNIKQTKPTQHLLRQLKRTQMAMQLQ